jgi:multidrug efflux pump subunit AcrB
MDIIQAALRRPITVVVIVLGVLLTGGAALFKIPRDIFPNLNVPVIYVAQPYAGMDAAQMEGYLTYRYEIGFLYVSGIEHIESKSVQGMALMKLQFYPDTDMANAMAETINQIQRAQRFMPKGSVPPFVIRFDAGSVPVGNLVFSSETRSEAELQDYAVNRVRPMFASIPGISAPPPFGGSERSIVIHLDPDRLRAYRLSAMEVVEAINTTNTMSPSGNARIGKRMPTVALNSVVTDIRELGNVPVRRGSQPTVFIRDVATIEDSSTIETGYALVGGRRTVYIPIAKRAEASTLTVVNSLKDVIPRFQAALPEDVKVSYQFDQSYFVTRSIDNLSMEGLMGAILTGLMVLLFLQDWRSALVVIVSIPLSLTCAIIGLWLTGQTINIMTLGGLALAVGVLVDEATVAIENIHAHLARGKARGRAVLDASRETIIPRLLAMLSILAVFTPAFFMTGATRAMFVPLALAVGFSMVASYFISSTVVPIMASWLLKADHGGGHAAEASPAAHSRFSFATLQNKYSTVLGLVTKYRGPVIAGYLAVAVLIIVGLGSQMGTEIFPLSDEGQLTLRFRAAEGTRIEETEKTAGRILKIIEREAGPGNVDTTLGYVGTQSSDHPINAIYLWTGGPEEGVLQVQMRHGWGVSIEAFKETLRRTIAAELPQLRVSFEPSDIVSRVMSFGTSTPVEVAVTSPDLAASRKLAERLQESLGKIASLRDLQISQSLDYPAVKIEVDREKAGLVGLSMNDISNAYVPATSTSRYIYKNLWPDPRTGVTYFVEVEVPEHRMDSVEEIRNIPLGAGPSKEIRKTDSTRPVLLRDVARLQSGSILGEYDRYNLQRTVTITANIAGDDLGRVTKAVRKAVADIGAPPRGISIAVRGQVSTMEQIFQGLRSGLIVTVVAIFLLLAANFQSWKLAFVIVSTVPAVLAGVVVMLLSTGTTLNIQSFMGCIMSVGVAVANAILLITFAERYRKEGMSSERAAIEGARGRLRPILMTSFAMVAGMVPMALGLSEGGSQAAPLGRAVIGGLAVATVATLFILPAVFASVQRKASSDSPSLDPHDRESRHYAPAGGEGEA